MLPETIQWLDIPQVGMDGDGFTDLVWKAKYDPTHVTRSFMSGIVFETELLHLCNEVERTKLKGLQINVYCRALEFECDCMMAALDAYAATWQQRTIALAKTLGVEIV